MIDITKFEGHTAGPWQQDKGGWITTEPEDLFIGSVGAMRGRVTDLANARLIAAAPDLLAEVIRLRDMLQKARDGLSCGLWDYGPGQSEHDQCDELIAEIDEMLKGGAA